MTLSAENWLSVKYHKPLFFVAENCESHLKTIKSAENWLSVT
jgi:hypothetical protein